MAIPAHSGFVGMCVDLTFALLGQTLCERAVHRRLAYKGGNVRPGGVPLVYRALIQRQMAFDLQSDGNCIAVSGTFGCISNNSNSRSRH